MHHGLHLIDINIQHLTQLDPRSNDLNNQHQNKFRRAPCAHRGNNSTNPRRQIIVQKQLQYEVEMLHMVPQEEVVVEKKKFKSWN